MISDKHHNACLKKAGDTEPLFIVRGQDVTGPAVVLFWLALNINNITEAKARAAFEDAMDMKHHHPRKTAD